MKFFFRGPGRPRAFEGRLCATTHRRSPRARHREAQKCVFCAHLGRFRVDWAWLIAISAAEEACARSGRQWSYLRHGVGARILVRRILIVMVNLSVTIAILDSTAQEELRLPLHAFLAAFQIRLGPLIATFASRALFLQLVLRRVLPVRVGSTRRTKVRATAFRALIRSAATVAVLSVQKL